MDLEDIKIGLRAEIKKRENEQYATFQCSAGLVQWLASGDPIQARINKEEA